MSMTFNVVLENFPVNTLVFNYVASRIGINGEIVSLNINNAQMLSNWVWSCYSVILHTNDSITALKSLILVWELLSNVEMCQLHDIPFYQLCTPFTFLTEIILHSTDYK